MGITHFILPPATVYEVPQLSQVINNITDTASWIIATVLIIFVFSFGVQFLLTADNPVERAKLKGKIIWTLIGIFIILSAHPLSAWIQSIL